MLRSVERTKANRQMTGTLLYNTRRDSGGQDAFVVKLTAPNYVVSLTSATNPVLSGQPVTVTASVTSPGKPPITTSALPACNNCQGRYETPPPNQFQPLAKRV